MIKKIKNYFRKNKLLKEDLQILEKQKEFLLEYMCESVKREDALKKENNQLKSKISYLDNMIGKLVDTDLPDIEDGKEIPFQVDYTK